jgi:three-Cys-motif partner protein
LCIDGFAGPGRYTGGEDGSPIVMIKAALKQAAKITAEVVFIFVEKDKDRYEHLVETLSELSGQLPKNFKYHCVHGEFDEELSARLDEINGKNKKLAPSLVFIDPFGFSHTPYVTIARILTNDRCEVLITFMFEEINRFLSHPDHPETYDNLFGTNRWREALKVTSASERRRIIHDIYRDQLRHVRSFEMMNAGNSTDYFLFFATNNVLGLEKMKEAMWRVDSTGQFSFSDFTDAKGTLSLFANNPNYPALKDLISCNFQNKKADVSAVENFVVAETPFLASHFKRILKEMEAKGEVSVVNPKPRRRVGTFPDGTELEFSPKRQ